MRWRGGEKERGRKGAVRGERYTMRVQNYKTARL
jgi:hypothetical protein